MEEEGTTEMYCFDIKKKNLDYFSFKSSKKKKNLKKKDPSAVSLGSCELFSVTAFIKPLSGMLPLPALAVTAASNGQTVLETQDKCD